MAEKEYHSVLMSSAKEHLQTAKLQLSLKAICAYREQMSMRGFGYNVRGARHSAQSRLPRRDLNANNLVKTYNENTSNVPPVESNAPSYNIKFSNRSVQTTRWHSISEHSANLQHLQPSPISVTISPNCICQRPPCIVSCVTCGYHIKGRISRPCSEHANYLFLMDMHQCPNCKGSELQEFEISQDK